MIGTMATPAHDSSGRLRASNGFAYKRGDGYSGNHVAIYCDNTSTSSNEWPGSHGMVQHATTSTAAATSSAGSTPATATTAATTTAEDACQISAVWYAATRLISHDVSQC